MKPKHFLRQLDHDRIVEAIREAERHTSGEIRVFISHRHVPDPVAAATHRFAKLKMHKTRHRNAVLIFVAPKSQTFAIIGDEGVHARCGDEFWTRTAEEMGRHFKQQKFTDGLLHGIQIAGKLLAEHFPHRGGDSNEVSDSVVED